MFFRYSGKLFYLKISFQKIKRIKSSKNKNKNKSDNTPIVIQINSFAKDK